MSAKGIFESVISRGGFDLTAMLARIDEYHIEGKIDDDELTGSVLPEKTESQPMKLQLKMVFKAQKNNGWLV